MLLIDLFRREPQVNNLLSTQEFHRAMDKERMRVDRNGSHFAVLVFDCGQTPCLQRMNRFATALESELRFIDQPGLLDRYHVAVLLPDTDAAGAKALHKRLAAVFKEDGPAGPSQILVYPEDALPAVGQTCDAVAMSADELFVEPLPVWKRCLDVLVGSIAIVLASPIMLLAALAIKLTSPGPILFKQLRAGLGGRPFTIYKFRTMQEGAEELKASLRAFNEQDGPAFKIKDDPRVSFVGAYLRRTCIDEFPQFWNVLIGDMSLVGPRPLPIDEAAECEPWQRRRMTVTPGMTCIWQVSGGMRNSFTEWMRMDLRYARSRKLLGDLALLWKTFWVVVLHRASH